MGADGEVAVDHSDDAESEPGQSPHGIGILVQGFERAALLGFALALDQRDEEMLLVLEIDVERALRHVRGGCDITHAGGVEAARGEDVQGAVQDLAALVGIGAGDPAIAWSRLYRAFRAFRHLIPARSAGPAWQLRKRIEPIGSIWLDMHHAPRYFKRNRTGWFELTCRTPNVC